MFITPFSCSCPALSSPGNTPTTAQNINSVNELGTLMRVLGVVTRDGGKIKSVWVINVTRAVKVNFTAHCASGKLDIPDSIVKID